MGEAWERRGSNKGADYRQVAAAAVVVLEVQHAVDGLVQLHLRRRVDGRGVRRGEMVRWEGVGVVEGGLYRAHTRA